MRENGSERLSDSHKFLIIIFEIKNFDSMKKIREVGDQKAFGCPIFFLANSSVCLLIYCREAKYNLMRKKYKKNRYICYLSLVSVWVDDIRL